MYIWSTVGVCLVLYIVFRFFKEIGKSLPILELMLMIAGLQWIIGAFNAYRLSVEHYKYYMRVDEETYMSFVVPAFLFFSVTLLFSIKKYKIRLQFNPAYYVQYGRYILSIGIIADLLYFIIPSSLMFFIYLVSLFKFVGAGILLFSKNKKDRIFFYGCLIYLALRSLNNAMFHDFILWGVFLFLIWALKNKPTVKTKVLILVSGLLVVMSIQMVKHTFRAAVWGGNSGNKIELFLDVLETSWSDSYFKNEENLSELNVRLNQGWIISQIIDYVPNQEPYAKGSTILDAVYAGFVPRILFPDKAIANGRNNFQKYTGLALSESAAMGISIIGESYANFGVLGGILFMMVYAGFLGWYWKKIVRLLEKHPLLLLFIPLLFFQVIKAETELLSVLGHLIKSSIVVSLFFWFFKKYFNWKI